MGRIYNEFGVLLYWKGGGETGWSVKKEGCKERGFIV